LVRPPASRKDMNFGAIRDVLVSLHKEQAVRTPPLDLERKTSDDGLVLVPGGLFQARDEEMKEEKKDPPVPAPLKVFARAMFKADHPYRTRLGLTSLLATNASGVVSTTVAATLLTSTTEWSSIDALFDEFFIHAMHLTFAPLNSGGGGVYAATGTAFGTPTFAASASETVTSCGLQLVSLQGSAAGYSSATAMLANPSMVVRMSNKEFKYSWKNTVLFKPHGDTLNLTSVAGWQGWMSITSGAGYGGAIQFRTVADQVLGDASHAFSLGNYNVVWDVSFRTRA